MPSPEAIFWTYLAVISAISVAVCIYDKLASIAIKRHRMREALLLFLSAMGGSVAMLLTMLGIKHKTKHIKFMLGIPLIILLQAAIALGLLFFI